VKHISKPEGYDARYPKTFPIPAHKIITVTIDENGDQVFLKTDSADCFLELGEVITKRASHVEPAGWLLRLAFNLLRILSSDTSKVAAWTRTWACEWRVDTSPVGGPVLTWEHVAPSPVAAWMDHRTFTTHDRQAAISAEIAFLNKFFAERTL
jgi:hypothetical protein